MSEITGSTHIRQRTLQEGTFEEIQRVYRLLDEMYHVDIKQLRLQLRDIEKKLDMLLTGKEDT